MFIEYQFNGFSLDLASELRNLRNNGNENVIVGFIQPSEKLWFQHLHDWCQIFMKNPPVFLMIDTIIQFGYSTYCEEFSFSNFHYACYASLGLYLDFDLGNCFEENERKFEENRTSCGSRLQSIQCINRINGTCIPNMIYIPPTSQPSDLVDWIKRLVEPKCIVFDDCANHTHME